MSYSGVNRLLKYQRNSIDKLDKETVRELYPQLERASLYIQESLNRLSADQWSYKSRIRTMALINNSLGHMESRMEGQLEKRAEQYNLFAREAVQGELKEFDAWKFYQLPSVKKEAVSVKSNTFLINTMKNSLKSYGIKTRGQVSDVITQGILQKKSGYEISNRIGQRIQLHRYKIIRIVRTELSRIFNQSKLLNYFEIQKTHFPDLMKRLYHPMDNRTGEDSKQLAKLNPAIPLGKPFEFTYRRKLKSGRIVRQKRVFMTPPDRPNDRAQMISFRPKWNQDV